MGRFDTCLNFVLSVEGGYINDPTDKGGATNKGITQKTYDAFRKKIGVSPRDVKDLTADEVSAIYKLDYWNTAKCNILPIPIDLMTFDASVNHGPGRAVKMLQSVLGVSTDGHFGPVSIRALQQDMSRYPVQEFVDHLIAERLDFYHSIVERDPSQARFIHGWENRMALLRKAAV